MIFANFWFLKRSNGMAFYGIDYVNQLLELGINITVIKKNNVSIQIAQHPLLTVLEVGFFSFLLLYFKIIFCRASVYCPTMHALPFVRHQVFTIHDAYPLIKNHPKSNFNRILFRLMLKYKNTTIATINNSIHKQLPQFDLSQNLYAPNLVETHNLKVHKKKDLSINKIRVGLIGTDSEKKNYENLFGIYSSYDTTRYFSFHIYGNDTPYIDKIKRTFPELRIELVKNDASDIDTFFKHVDIILSVARNEGFCRPIAHAICSGMTCILIDDDVFKEFYSDLAIFGSDEAEVVELLCNLSNALLNNKQKIEDFLYSNSNNFYLASQRINDLLSDKVQ